LIPEEIRGLEYRSTTDDAGALGGATMRWQSRKTGRGRLLRSEDTIGAPRVRLGTKWPGKRGRRKKGRRKRRRGRGMRG
jgi:hypothetical protein